MLGGDSMEKVRTPVRGTGTRVFDKRFLSLSLSLSLSGPVSIRNFRFSSRTRNERESVLVTRLGNSCIRFICMRSTYTTHD